YLIDTAPAGNQGSQLLFGDVAFGPSAGIKNLLQSGVGPERDLVVQTRAATEGQPMVERMRISQSGSVSITSPNDSASPTTGALTVAGGVGVGGALVTGAAISPGASVLSGFYLGAYNATHPIIAFEGNHYFM